MILRVIGLGNVRISLSHCPIGATTILKSFVGTISMLPMFVLDTKILGRYAGVQDMYVYEY